jgi:hypothetical protein
MIYKKTPLFLLLAGILLSITPQQTRASVVSDPGYYVSAEVREINVLRGGLHRISFIITDLVENQSKFGGYAVPDTLGENLSKDTVFTCEITPNPDVSPETGETIVIGVIHGSSMGEKRPVSWTLFARPYLENGTPLGLHYPVRN